MKSIVYHFFHMNGLSTPVSHVAFNCFLKILHQISAILSNAFTSLRTLNTFLELKTFRLRYVFTTMLIQRTNTNQKKKIQSISFWIRRRKEPFQIDTTKVTVRIRLDMKRSPFSGPIEKPFFLFFIRSKRKRCLLFPSLFCPLNKKRMK